MILMSIRSWLDNRSPQSIEEQVAKIQQGDIQLREELINQYKPFIKKAISKVCKRFIDESMDEFSVGLIAFDEAITQFRNEEGSKFLTFANVVISRRIIDHIRKEQRNHKRVFLHYEEEDEDGNVSESLAEQAAAITDFENKLQQENRVDEINEYQALLHKFGITFEVLSKQCPKHIDARKNAVDIAKQVADHPELSRYLLEKKRLPIKDLEPLITSSRKTVERNRNYIIAISLIHLGNFVSLKSYIEQ